MKFKITNNWQRKEELATLFFFAQRLDELFFDYTLDTYKPPALNSVFLCKEAIRLIIDIENDLIDVANLNYVLDELLWSLKQDPSVDLMLHAPPESFILRGDSVKLSDTRIRLEVLERTLNPLGYLEVCETLIKEAILEGSKKKLGVITRNYASNLINMGVTKQHLYEQTQKFFFGETNIDSIEEIDEFFESVTVISHHYEIYFLVSSLIRDVAESKSSFDLEIIEDLPEDVTQLANERGLEPNETEVWVEVKNIQTFDRYSAREKAEKRLDMVRDMFLLFSHKNIISWRSEAIITQCCDEIPILIRKPKNPMEKCFDLRPKEASTRLNSLIKNIGLEGNSFIKFHRAVDLHAISATNDLSENQLLNVWIALETLVPSHVHGGGKVVKVINGIMPILLRNYIPRLVQRLAADLIRWDRKKTSKILRNINSPKDKGLYQKVLELITLSSNDDVLNSLYSELDHFHLLRNRVFEMREMLKKPKNVIKRIELHEKKVNWQLRRIYRTRNLIVHSGSSISFIDTLIENAHDYLDQTIEEVLFYSCGPLDAQTLEQAFEMAKMNYDVYLKELRDLEEVNEDNIVHVMM